MLGGEGRGAADEVPRRWRPRASTSGSPTPEGDRHLAIAAALAARMRLLQTEELPLLAPGWH